MHLAPQRPAHARHLSALFAALGLVLLVHALLLGLLPLGGGGGWQGGMRTARPAMQARQIVRGPVVAAQQPGMEAPRAAEARPARAAQTVEAAAPPPSPPAAAAPGARPAREPAEPTPEPTAGPTADPGSAPSPDAVPAAQAAEGGAAPPVYATRLPPAAQLFYAVRFGAMSGRGELLWQPGPEHYEITLDASAFAVKVLAWTSRGGYDAAGLAPERFTDRRRGRDLRAANFQRDKGLVTYSGPAVQYPLLPGAQDRLSWMLQLPAIVAAEPALYMPGSRISLFVTGARGDGDVWTFNVEAQDDIALPAGPVSGALRLRREPRKPYDTQVDVWLDPARAHLPVRVRLSVPQTGDATEFLLEAAHLAQ